MDGVGNEIDVVRAQEEYQTKLDEHLKSQNQPKKKEVIKRKESEFAALKKELTTAKTIAHYIEANHQTTLRESKGLLTFIQVISNRPEKLYAKLFRKYKPHVTLVVERIVGFVQGSQGSGKLAKGQSSAGKATLTATAHEFLIRCERAGVHKKAWFAALKSEDDIEDESDSDVDAEKEAGSADDDDDDEEKPKAGAVRKITIQGGTPSASSTQRIADVLSAHLTPKMMLKLLSEVDTMGRLTRMVEITTSVDTCRDVAERIVGAEDLSGSEKIQLHTRLLSKVRRLIAPFGSTKHAAEEDEAKSTTTTKSTSNVVVATREEAESIVKLCLDLSYELFVRQKLAPTTKYAKFVEWCKEQVGEGKSLIPKGYNGIVEEVDTHNDQAMASQATAIEVLLALKGAEDGGLPDANAGTAVPEDAVGWGEDDTPTATSKGGDASSSSSEQKKGTVKVKDLAYVIGTISGSSVEEGMNVEFFTVTGMDVLSAVAVSAGKKLIADDLKTPTEKDEGCKSIRQRIVAMFINTVKRSNGTLSLPRRAVNFIADEKKKIQISDVAALRKKRAREDADRSHLMSSRQIQEEIEGDDLMERE